MHISGPSACVPVCSEVGDASAAVFNAVGKIESAADGVCLGSARREVFGMVSVGVAATGDDGDDDDDSGFSIALLIDG